MSGGAPRRPLGAEDCDTDDIVARFWDGGTYLLPTTLCDPGISFGAIIEMEITELFYDTSISRFKSSLIFVHTGEVKLLCI